MLQELREALGVVRLALARTGARLTVRFVGVEKNTGDECPMAITPAAKTTSYIYCGQLNYPLAIRERD